MNNVWLMHCGALIDCRVNTNEWRQALQRVAKMLRPYRTTPLMELGSYVYGSNITRTPTKLLLAAFGHVEARLVGLSDTTGRGRKHMRWLGKWQRLICTEIDRRRAAGERIDDR